MKTYDIRNLNEVRLSGRFDMTQQGFPMHWSSANAEMLLSASKLEVEIVCQYNSQKPYLSFEVDGLRAQTFSPIPGKHWYNVFLNLDKNTKHRVRIIKETQPFEGDPTASPTILRLRTDGQFHPLPKVKRRIEFIGDSITSGEGGRGPVSFNEWVPMCFCAADNYARMTADGLKAQYQVISQSGWGAYCSFDNRPEGNIPRVYDQICGVLANGTENQGVENPYDFSFQPDTVVVALGANDSNAMRSDPYIDPVTGAAHKLDNSSEGRQLYENTCFNFLLHLHEVNPGARLVWLSFISSGPIAECLQKAVARAKDAGLDVTFACPFDFESFGGRCMGSRFHPGILAHKKIAKALVKLLK